MMNIVFSLVLSVLPLAACYIKCIEFVVKRVFFVFSRAQHSDIKRYRESPAGT